MSDTTLQATGGSFQIGTVLVSSFKTLFRNLTGFLLASFLLSIPWIVLIIVAETTADPDTKTTLTAVSTLVGIPTYLLATAALTYGTYQDLNGARAGMAEIVGRAFSVLPSAVVAVILLSLILVVGFVLLVVPGVIAMCVLYVVLPVVVVERPGAKASLRRSANLTKDNRWKVFALILAGTAVNVVLAFVLGAVGVAVDLALMDGDTVGAPVTAVLSAVAQFLGMTWGAVLVAIAYFELRRVKEGLNLDQLAAVFD